MTIDLKHAQVVLSGGFERRRGYLSSMLYTLNQVTVTTVVAIWAFLIRWDAVTKPTGIDWELFAREAAWAGAIASLVIGIWRIFARELDAEIIRLYPALYLCERTLLPSEVCTIKPPRGVTELSEIGSDSQFEYRVIGNAAFGSRLHGFLDWLGVASIIGFGLLSVVPGLKSGAMVLTPFGPPHLISYMLAGNVAGVIGIVCAYSLWRRKTVRWPVRIKTPNAT
jgi:hypothetical protein